MFEFSQNTKQRIKSSFLFLLTGFKTIIATLLSIFVHQVCTTSGQECSVTENLTDLTSFNAAVVSFNFITLGIFVGMYILEFYRENWCMNWLDVEKTLPADNLKTEIEAYTDIKTRLRVLNVRYCRYAVFLSGVVLINVLLSAILMTQYYGGYKTITSFLTNVFLVCDKLYACVYISHASYRDMLPYSAYMKDYIVFNAIDKKHKLTPVQALAA